MNTITATAAMVEARMPARIESGLAHCDLGQVPVNSNGFIGNAQIMLRPEQLQLSGAVLGTQGCPAVVTERDNRKVSQDARAVASMTLAFAHLGRARTRRAMRYRQLGQCRFARNRLALLPLAALDLLQHMLFDALKRRDRRRLGGLSNSG